MLKPSEKKYFSEVFDYYFTTTGTPFEDYVTMVTELINTPNSPHVCSTYAGWLLNKCLEMLKAKGISTAVCIENKDMVRTIAIGEQSRNEGEFYTPEVWCKFGRDYMQNLLPNVWGDANVWDIACYDMDTEILTDRGWLRFNNLVTADNILTLNPLTRSSEWITGFKKVSRKFTGRMYSFKSADIDLYVTDTHKMVTYNDKNGQINFVPASDVANNREELGSIVTNAVLPEGTTDNIAMSSTEYVSLSEVDITSEDVVDLSVWDISLPKNHIFYVRRKGKSCFCGNCGTGNLMRTSDYPSDKLFLSTLLAEDLVAVKRSYPEATVFQLDACNGIDYDEYNMLFSNQLPDNLRKKLEADEPLIFYINPPYKVGFGGQTDIALHMAQNGFGRSAVDIYHHFLYRICLLKDTYHLTNVHIGVFGPTGWLQSRINNEFREFVFNHFEFKGGMSFPASEFANVGDGNDWLISMSVWSGRNEPCTEYPDVIFDACQKNAEGIPTVIGTQLVKPTDIRLHDWCKPNDSVRYHLVPTQSSASNFGSSLQKEPDNTLMTLMSENTVIDGVRRSAIMTFTHTTSVPVTPENFWRCIASFGARSVTDDQDAFLGRQVFSAPDTAIEGWNNFLADSLVLAIFAMNSYAYSYRDVEICGSLWSRNNNFFPLSEAQVEGLTKDPAILADMQSHPCNNTVMLEAIRWAAPFMSKEAVELYDWSVSKLASSLEGTARRNAGYKNWTIAHDASLTQIRSVPELWSEDDTKQLKILLSKLRTILKPQVAKFGFVIEKEGK